MSANAKQEACGERQTLLRHIQDAPGERAAELWVPDAEDWAVLGTFAAKPGLPYEIYDQLHSRRSWFLDITLGHNPGVPLLLLRRMAEVSSTATIEEITLTLDALAVDDIRRIARCVLARRLAAKSRP